MIKKLTDWLYEVDPSITYEDFPKLVEDAAKEGIKYLRFKHGMVDVQSVETHKSCYTKMTAEAENYYKSSLDANDFMASRNLRYAIKSAAANYCLYNRTNGQNCMFFHNNNLSNIKNMTNFCLITLHLD